MVVALPAGLSRQHAGAGGAGDTLLLAAPEPARAGCCAEERAPPAPPLLAVACAVPLSRAPPGRLPTQLCAVGVLRAEARGAAARGARSGGGLQRAGDAPWVELVRVADSHGGGVRLECAFAAGARAAQPRSGVVVVEYEYVEQHVPARAGLLRVCCGEFDGGSASLMGRLVEAADGARAAQLLAHVALDLKPPARTGLAPALEPAARAALGVLRVLGAARRRQWCAAGALLRRGLPPGAERPAARASATVGYLLDVLGAAGDTAGDAAAEVDARAVHLGVDACLGAVAGLALWARAASAANASAALLEALRGSLYGPALSWLAGAPGGVKLNAELAAGVAVLVRGLDSAGGEAVEALGVDCLLVMRFVAVVFLFGGTAAGLTALADALAAAALPLRAAAIVVALGARLQRHTLGALVLQARGRRWNAQRERYDAYTPDEDVLMAGAFAITVLLLLLPTVIVFHVALCAAALAAALPCLLAHTAASVACDADLCALVAAPLAPGLYPDGVSLEPLPGAPSIADGAARLRLTRRSKGALRAAFGPTAPRLRDGAWHWAKAQGLALVVGRWPPCCT